MSMLRSLMRPNYTGDRVHMPTYMEPEFTRSFEKVWFYKNKFDVLLSAVFFSAGIICAGDRIEAVVDARQKNAAEAEQLAELLCSDTGDTDVCAELIDIDFPALEYLVAGVAVGASIGGFSGMTREHWPVGKKLSTGVQANTYQPSVFAENLYPDIRTHGPGGIR